MIFGVSEKNKNEIVGTNFKNGSDLLEKFKYEVSKGTNDNMTFIDIIEVLPVVNGKEFRVLMFKIPAAVTGFPTSWNNRFYARSGDSLIPLQQYKIDIIRSQEKLDWSKQLIEGATIDCLDKNAILIAREKYKEKMDRIHISEEVDKMSDEEFLTKTKLIQNGKITNTAMLLLGNEDYDYLFTTPPEASWRLYDSRNDVKGL